MEKLARVTGISKGKGALGYLEKALSIYEALGDSRKAAGVHLRLAEQYQQYEMGAPDSARSYSHASKAVALLEPEGESLQLAQAYSRLGWTTVHQPGSLSAGMAPLEKSLALAEQLGDTDAIAETATSLAHALLVHTGELQRGVQLTHQSYEAAMRSGNATALSRAVNELSRSSTLLHDPESALPWAEQAVKASRQSGEFRRQLAPLVSLAWSFMLRGDMARARSRLETAQQMASKAGVELRQIGPPTAVPGLVSLFLGDWDEAEAELLQCLERAKEGHAALAQQAAAQILGWLYLERGDLASAKMRLQEAVAIAQARGEKTLGVFPCALYAEVAAKAGELAEAASHLRQAQEIISNGEVWRGLAAEVHLAEGVLATAQQHWPEAEAAFQKAVATNRQYHLPYYEARSLLEWGEMYLSRSRGAASGAPTGGGPTGQDRDRGMQLLDQALAIFQRVQAKKMVEKVLARKELLRA